MNIRTNAGYIITDCIHIGDSELVLGIHSTQPNSYVTWEYNDKNDSYFWGHYFTDLFAAQKDLTKRSSEKVKQYEFYLGINKDKDRERNF